MSDIFNWQLKFGIVCLVWQCSKVLSTSNHPFYTFVFYFRRISYVILQCSNVYQINCYKVPMLFSVHDDRFLIFGVFVCHWLVCDLQGYKEIEKLTKLKKLRLEGKAEAGTSITVLGDSLKQLKEWVFLWGQLNWKRMLKSKIGLLSRSRP